MRTLRMGKTVRTCVGGGPVQALRQTKSVWHCACVGRLIFYYGAKKPQVPLGGFLAPLKGGRREEVGWGGLFKTPVPLLCCTSRILPRETQQE